MKETKKKKFAAFCLTVIMIMTFASGITVSAEERSAGNKADYVATDVCIREMAYKNMQNTAEESGEGVSEPAAKIGEKEYETIYDAVADAEQGAVIYVQKDITLSSDIWIEYGKKVTIDLGGHTLIQNNNSFAIVVIDEGSELTLQNGSVVGTTQKSLLITSEAKIITKNLKISGAKGMQVGQAGIWGEAVIEEGTTIEAEKQGIVVAGASLDPDLENISKVSKLTVNGGSISGKIIGISGNGSQHGTEITIHNGTINGGELGIYHPQLGTMNISGGTVTGPTGIEIRAGELNISGSTVIKGTAAPLEVHPSESGNTTTGAGIAVIQHSTKLPVIVNIEGGTIQGYSALYEANPEENEAEAIAKVQINIAAGAFEAINGGNKAVYSEDVERFVYGGNYSDPVEKKYLSENLTAELKKADSNVPYSYYESVDAALAKATGNDVITDLTDPNSNVTIILKNGYNDVVITIRGRSFTLPTYERDGYKFLGWSDGAKQYKAGEVVKVTKNTAFTALWESNTTEPGEPEKPEKPEEPSKPSKPGQANPPKTGDEAHASIYVLAILMGVMMLTGAYAMKKKNGQ